MYDRTWRRYLRTARRRRRRTAMATSRPATGPDGRAGPRRSSPTVENAPCRFGIERLARDREAFRTEKQDRRSLAALRLALGVGLGVDADRLGEMDGEGLATLARRIARRLERERLKGVSGHWSYDLNRQIGLKHALDAVRSMIARRPG